MYHYEIHHFQARIFCRATGWLVSSLPRHQPSPTWGTQDGGSANNHKTKILKIRFGDPIPFGESVSFVCEKGMAFEEDYHQTSFEVTCQVLRFNFSTSMCKSQRTRTGRRAEAKKVISLFQRTMSGQTVSEVTTNTFNIIFEENIETTKIVLAGPLCSAPPEIPFEGRVEVIPGTFQLQPISSCQVKKDSGHVALHFSGS